MTTIKIRKAHLGDLMGIVSLCARGVQDGAWSGFGGDMAPFHPPHVVRLITDKIEGSLIWVAVEADGDRERLVGMIAYRLQEWFWSPKCFFFESMHIYLQPEARAKKTENGHLVADDLLATGRELSDRTGMPTVITTMFGDDVARRDAFIERCGYKYVGGNFLYMPAAKVEAAE